MTTVVMSKVSLLMQFTITGKLWCNKLIHFASKNFGHISWVNFLHNFITSFTNLYTNIALRIDFGQVDKSFVQKYLTHKDTENYDAKNYDISKSTGHMTKQTPWTQPKVQFVGSKLTTTKPRELFLKEEIIWNKPFSILIMRTSILQILTSPWIAFVNSWYSKSAQPIKLILSGGKFWSS